MTPHTIDAPVTGQIHPIALQMGARWMCQLVAGWKRKGETLDYAPPGYHAGDYWAEIIHKGKYLGPDEMGVEPVWRLELTPDEAADIYEARVVSLGRAAELSNIPRKDFEEILASRGIERDTCTFEELQEELQQD